MTFAGLSWVWTGAGGRMEGAVCSVSTGSWLAKAAEGRALTI